VSGEAVVGYLAISIPFIAWAALKRMENFGTALVGGLSGLQGMLSGSTGAAAVGNVHLGNVAMDQFQLSPNRTSAFMSSWQNDLSGNTFSSNALTGRTAVSLLRNQGYASRVVSMRVSEQDVQDASRQVDAARSESVAASNERSAVLAEAFTKGVAKLRASRSSSGSTSSSFEQFGKTLNRLDQISKSVADTTGLTQAQVARIAIGASGHLGVNTPLAGLQGNAVADKNYSSSLSSAEQKALSSMTSEQLAEFKQFGDRASRDRSFMSVLASDAREAQDLTARLASTTARSERADASLSERSAFAERLFTAYERGETISIDIAQDPHNLAMFTRYAEQYGGSSASARVLMEAELARQSLRPQRVFSDGSAVPTTFGDLQAHHRQNSGDPELAPDLTERHRANQGDLRRISGAPQPEPTAGAPSSVRSTIREEGERIRTSTSADQTAFDRNAKTTKTPEGILASERSLMLQTGKQAKEDAAPFVDTAKQAVKDALKK
jgi:conjugal transfer mating pair stabilization protein TraG